MTAVTLLPCPFCGGPPVPIVTNFLTRAVVCLQEEYDDVMVRAVVFCHECGSEGPDATPFLLDAEDYHAAVVEAVNLWNLRDTRHLCMYDAGTPLGLNLYPRGGA